MGGTIISSALRWKDIINKRYHPSSWNIYTFYSGDGENWSFDNPKAVKLFEDLKNLSQMIRYAEIDPHSHLTNETWRRIQFWHASDPLNQDGLWYDFAAASGRKIQTRKD